MKRKNLAKYFAIAGCALCLPLALVGCGDPSIVDTSGNYSTELNATQMSEYIDQTATIAESTKSYQFRVVFEMSGQNVSQRIEGEGNVDFTTGEMMFDASISASANGESLDYHGSVYYDGLSYYEQNGNAWENVQNSNITSGFNVLAGYCSYDILESYKNVVDDFIGYKAEKDGEVRIRLSTVEEPQFDVYLVFDQDGFFKAFKIDFNYSTQGGSHIMTIEWLASEEAVESPIETPVE